MSTNAEVLHNVRFVSDTISSFREFTVSTPIIEGLSRTPLPLKFSLSSNDSRALARRLTASTQVRRAHHCDNSLKKTREIVPLVDESLLVRMHVLKNKLLHHAYLVVEDENYVNKFPSINQHTHRKLRQAFDAILQQFSSNGNRKSMLSANRSFQAQNLTCSTLLQTILSRAPEDRENIAPILSIDDDIVQISPPAPPRLEIKAHTELCDISDSLQIGLQKSRGTNSQKHSVLGEVRDTLRAREKLPSTPRLALNTT
ncbi:hypothetical protein ALC53_06226 [Atta colombica]|uniref:Uncharacterized protein n=1 Tax=Atta colombica TaxID=520822 RepID=A0A151I344_9HYME|nr:hypothetical protein ALC53_06226 [Atta colombica]